MQSLSVVIVCKNEVDIIGRTLQSLRGLTDDIVVYDNGSTDETRKMVKQFNVQLHEGSWEGFGKTKNKAISLALYDWILSLDSDETVDDELKGSLMAEQLKDETTVYEVSFKNFLGKKHLKYGEWGRDKHIRLFNRKNICWDDAPVHEQLIVPEGTKKKKLKGHLLHRTMKDLSEYSSKMNEYALLNAEKYYRQGKKASWFKIRMAPGFTFLNYYFLKFGFLDGHEGFVCAKMTAYYTFLKYARLRELKNIEQMNNEQRTPK